MITVENVSKSYGAYEVLRDVSLVAHAGELVVLLGANGAGKSTLMSCFLGTTSYAGRIVIGGHDPLREGRATRNMIGYMPQSGSLHPEMTVLETVRFYAALRGVDQPLMPLLEEVALAEHAGKRVGELSGGMQQRLAFAIAQLGAPSLLLLDEPTASLDRDSRCMMVERLRALVARGTTVIVSTHADPELASSADRCIVLEEGRVVVARVDPKKTTKTNDCKPEAIAPQPVCSSDRAAGVGQVRRRDESDQ